MNLGDDIKNIVQAAINDGDFKKLNVEIEGMAKEALNEVKTAINWKDDKKNSTTNYIDSYEGSNKKVQELKNRISQNKVRIRDKGLTVPIGQISGTLFTVFGSLGVGIFGIALLVLTILGITISGGVFHAVAAGILPIFILSIILLGTGGKIRKRLKRFQRYIGRMNNRSYASIKDLSSAVGLSEKATARDLRKMISIGMFPQGRVDDGNTSFILSNEAYENYIELMRSTKLKELEEKKQISLEKEKISIGELDPEVKKTVEEGRSFIKEIKNANIVIPGEEISKKLDRLEEITSKIFDYVEKHPEKFLEIKKFTEYFLPTTLKLVDAYKKLDRQSIKGENILNAKKEIEDTLDTINQAFENLLDGLFEDMAMDISTDISVLEMMLAQEGLTDSKINLKSGRKRDE